MVLVGKLGFGDHDPMKRPTYDQIVDWNKRRGGQGRLGGELVTQIDALRVASNAISGISPTFIEFVPIRLVTLLEVFVRGIIDELVNFNEEYFDRGVKFTKDPKIDLAFAALVNRRELTVGDFVAHFVSFNNIDAVYSALNNLLGNFTKKLKEVHPRWSEDREK